VSRAPAVPLAGGPNRHGRGRIPVVAGEAERRRGRPAPRPQARGL